jgi:hypothetical protein
MPLLTQFWTWIKEPVSCFCYVDDAGVKQDYSEIDDFTFI